MNDTMHTPAVEETETAAAVEEAEILPTAESDGAAAVKKPGFLAELWKNKKKRKRLIWILLLLAVVALFAWGMSKLLSTDEGPTEVLTDTVMMGSITSTVEGSGTARAKESKAINISTTGTVVDVYVSEGDVVEVGTPLFSIDSPAAQDLVKKARAALEAKQKELEDLYDAANNLTVRAEFGGKLLEVSTEYEAGQDITKGTTIAKLVDDRVMKLEQYYSYAYEHDIRVGQTAQVSIPTMMETLEGTVVAVNKVSRISPEGSELFQVVVEIKNGGVLTEKMAASAVIEAGGQTIYPYEQGQLQYNRTVDVTTKVNGTIEWVNLMNYLDVEAGQSLMQITGSDNETEIYNAEEALATAQKELNEAQENLANLNAVAPISGTVIGLAITPGQELTEKTAVINISDTSTILVTAKIDERNIAYIKPGMYVDINQWGNTYSGFVETVSLNPTYENGAATYEATITVDNTEGMMYTGGSITYSLVASQSDGCLVLPIQCVKYVPDAETGESISVVFLQTDTRPDNAIDIADTSSIGVPAEGYFAVPVETGISDKYNVEILSGLNEGDVVFTQMLRQNSWG